jgi:Lon protease-like protein
VTQQTVPLFPLKTVLFPEGALPLRIFEPRYLDMVSSCMRSDAPFGAVLIAAGPEVVGEVRTHAQGTLANIRDWNQGDDGLLEIAAQGASRFRLLSLQRQADGLNVGTIEVLPAEPADPLPGEFSPFAELLQAVLDDLGGLYTSMERRYDDATWVGYRLAEILPLDLAARQLCLEMDDSLERLEYLRPFLQQLTQARTQ